MGHLLKLKYLHSSVPSAYIFKCPIFRSTTVQTPNSALTETKRFTVISQLKKILGSLKTTTVSKCHLNLYLSCLFFCPQETSFQYVCQVSELFFHYCNSIAWKKILYVFCLILIVNHISRLSLFVGI